MAATIDQWALTLGGRHDLPGRFLLLGMTRYEANRVQYLQYRSTTLAGLGYSVLKSPKWNLIVAPGLGYSKSEQTPYGRILSFGNRQTPSVEGTAWGAHDTLMAQLGPTIMLQQNLIWLSAHFSQEWGKRIPGVAVYPVDARGLIAVNSEKANAIKQLAEQR